MCACSPRSTTSRSLSHEQVIDRAEAYRAEGADVIDLGLSLDRSWLAEGPRTIAALRERGLAVSIDTLDPEHIRMADAAGVDYVLSLTPRTIDMVADLRATPVLITDDPEDLDSLDRMAARMDQTGPALSARLDLGSHQLGLRRVAGPLRRGPSPPSPGRAC